ncbi:Origin recognition complex subunit 3 [Lunasporangiospora selenospora]|uniref:Origin recognition complex subunit 3 n=1 Tax=Lunasporangiospora selenospora TaxID=979761 RepID=A0A9P6FYK0_9FUNG|nr:Origin recognition complex subunit 3 [Lunasporangiospora selenospora]
MLNMNTIALSAIYSFVENAYNRAVTRAMPIKELPTGLIFAGINVPDHDLLFRQIATTLSSSTPPQMESSDMQNTHGDILDWTLPIPRTSRSRNHVVILQSKDCANLKSALKSMIDQFLALEVEGTTNPHSEGLRLQNYDMIVLERWYQSLCNSSQHRNQEGTESEQQQSPTETLVVIIQDFESFDQLSLQDLLTICSNYQDRIPFVFLMGLATSIDALHQGLPKSVMCMLQTRKFQMQQSSECLTTIIEDLFIQANVGLMVGPLPLKQLIDQFMHYNFSVGGFVANLKVQYLLVESKVESDPQEVEMLLKDDEFLTLQIPEWAQEIRTYRSNFSLMFEFLWFVQSQFSISILKRSKRTLYFMALEGTLTDSSHMTFLLSLVRKMNSNSMMVFVEEWLELFKNSKHNRLNQDREQEDPMDKEIAVIQSIRDRLMSLLDVVSEDSVTSSSEPEDNVENVEDEEGAMDGKEVVEGTTELLLSNDGIKAPIIKKRKLVSLNANDAESRQTRIAKKTRETARLPKGALGAYTLLVKEIDETIARLFSTYLGCYTRLSLNEVFYYSQVTIQQKAFLPQPRASVQMALGQPEQYLNCECCQRDAAAAGSSPAELVLPTQHDACILYKLYVECGRMINMFDWFTAFGMILERGQPSRASNKSARGKTALAKKKATLKRRRSGAGVHSEDDMDQDEQDGHEGRLDQEEVQARFISGVAELQFMGFIKPTSRKTDHVMRLTWGNI